MKNDTCKSLVHASKSHLVCITDQGAMKRLKMSDITVTGRPVRGELIAKKVKSNPNNIRYSIGCDNNTTITLLSEKPTVIQAKDVSLMSKESTYSNAMKLDKNFYLQKGILDVIKTPKKPKEENKESKELNQTSLFD